MKAELTGVIAGVDYQKANTGKNGVTYPAKILLKLGWEQEVEKEAGIKTINTGTFTVTVPLDNGESLVTEVDKYNKFINKEVTLELKDFHSLQDQWNNVAIQSSGVVPTPIKKAN